MRRLWLASALVLVGCASHVQPLPTPVVAPPTRTIYYQGASDGKSAALYSICDRGNRIYFNTAGSFSVVAAGCQDGQP